MKVKELKEQLANLPDNAKVGVYCPMDHWVSRIDKIYVGNKDSSHSDGEYQVKEYDYQGDSNAAMHFPEDTVVVIAGCY